MKAIGSRTGRVRRLREVEVEAEERVGAERQFAAILEQNPELWQQGESVGQPIYRLVDVAPAQQDEGAAKPGARAAA
jgi:hypothetical protein